jgi:hypothetical protein
VKRSFLLAIAVAALLAQSRPNVADTPTRAKAQDGRYISWKEHLIDDQQLSGVPLRGADGLQMADLDRDGHLDIVSVHEDSNHIRVAFGSANPDKWHLVTLAEGDEAAAAEDAAIADVNGDGWPDVIAACELAHLIYFQNPGKNARAGKWPRVIPANTKERGSFIRVFAADLNGDGRVEIITPNKGEQLPTDNPATEKSTALVKKPISWFSVPKNPLDPRGWLEHVLTEVRIPINSQPVDIDGDGDLDIFAGSRGENRVMVFENLGGKQPRFREWPVKFDNGNWSWAFMVEFHDFNGDGRLDAALVENRRRVVWIEQPKSIAEPWKVHVVGGILPDAATAIHIADLNGDGRADIVTGGYSQNPRDHDGEKITAESITGRIAWFENPGPGNAWIRHDVARNKRGMYDGFLSRDMDGDGDLDLVGTRGNSGNFDGVFWLEQVRSTEPRKAFTPARANESAPLPLPLVEKSRGL